MKRTLLSLALLLILAVSGLAFYVVSAHPSTTTPPPEFVHSQVDMSALCNATTPDTLSAPRIAECTALQADGATELAQYGADQFQSGVSSLGVGNGVCFADGQYTVNSTGCDGKAPPPITQCDYTVFTGTLNVVHNGEAEIPFNGGRLFMFRSAGCHSVWAAYHNDSFISSHAITISITELNSENSIENGINGDGVIVQPQNWESTYMEGYVPNTAYRIVVTVDGVILAHADVTPRP